jgi:putative membrane protein
MIALEKPLLALVALLHIGFFILERFVILTPLGQKIFKLSSEQAETCFTFAANQGVYNLFLAFGLIWAILCKNPNNAVPIKIFILLYIFGVGIYGTVTVGKTILILQAIPAIVTLLVVIAKLAQPGINDITTSFTSPPQFEVIAQNSKERDFSYSPEKFEKKQQDFFPLVLPMKINQSQQKTFDTVKNVAQIASWNIIETVSNDFKIEAQAKTQFLGFTDDIVIEVRKINDQLSEVHMRSKSRSGRSDFGVNSKRILDFFNQVRLNLNNQ